MTTDVNGDYRAAYTYGLERIGVEDLMEVEGKPNNPLYYLQDALGSITAITNMNGGIIDSNRFAPYGEPLDPVAKNARLTNSPYGFTGEMHDIEGRLLYLRARYYSPEMMRFIQQDTVFGEIENPLTGNLYIYGNANPLTFVDPSGHDSISSGSTRGGIKPLKLGDSGANVRKLQGGLNIWWLMSSMDSGNASPTIKVSGIFNKETEKRVNLFKDTNKISNSGSKKGVADEKTWIVLEPFMPKTDRILNYMSKNQIRMVNGKIVFGNKGASWSFVGLDILYASRSLQQSATGVRSVNDLNKIMSSSESVAVTHAVNNRKLKLSPEQLSILFQLDPNGVRDYMYLKDKSFVNETYTTLTGLQPQYYENTLFRGWQKTDRRSGDIFNAVRTDGQILLVRNDGMPKDLTDIAEPVIIAGAGYFILSQMTILATGMEMFGAKNAIYLYLSGALETTVNTFSERAANANLLDELASSGVKYNPKDVVMVAKNSGGKLMWLEKGNSKAGLTHILEKHADDFASQGINDIPKLLNDVLKTNPINTGSNAKGLYADYILSGNTYRIAYGTNGFIVSFYPID